MKTLKFLGIAAATMAFALPIAASAAAVTNQVTLNGGANATVPLGDTVQGNVNFTITSNTHVESFSYQVVDSSGNAQLPPVCIDSADHITDGFYNASFPIGTGSQSEGTFAIRIRLYGDPGIGVDNQCNPTDLVSTFTSPDILTISSPTDSTTQLGNPFTGNSTGFCALFPADCTNTGTGLTENTGFNFGNPGSSLSIFCTEHPVLCGFTPPPPVVINPPPQATSSTDAKLDKISDALDKIATLLTAPKGGNGESCQALSAVMDSLAFGSMGPSVSNLQVFLMANGEHVTNSGTPTQYFGPLTAAAVAAFKAQHGCN